MKIVNLCCQSAAPSAADMVIDRTKTRRGDPCCGVGTGAAGQGTFVQRRASDETPCPRLHVSPSEYKQLGHSATVMTLGVVPGTEKPMDVNGPYSGAAETIAYVTLGVFGTAAPARYNMGK